MGFTIGLLLSSKHPTTVPFTVIGVSPHACKFCMAYGSIVISGIYRAFSILPRVDYLKLILVQNEGYTFHTHTHPKMPQKNCHVWHHITGSIHIYVYFTTHCLQEDISSPFNLEQGSL
jgi:hypothetical protein